MGYTEDDEQLATSEGLGGPSGAGQAPGRQFAGQSCVRCQSVAFEAMGARGD